MWSELRKKEFELNELSKDRLAFEFYFEERTWYLASILNYYKIEKFKTKVADKMQKRVQSR